MESRSFARPKITTSISEERVKPERVARRLQRYRAMNLFRILSWALLLGATALAGPNLPAQALDSIRELVSGLRRRLPL